MSEEKVWTDEQKHAAAKALSKRVSVIWNAGGIGDEAAYRKAVNEQGCELNEAPTSTTMELAALE